MSKYREGGEKMIKRKLKVIPKPIEGTKAILIKKNGDSIIIFGKGNINLVCGKCGSTLAKGISEGQVRNLVLYCNNCESYNEI